MLERFINIFEGLKIAYGQYQKGERGENGKQKGRPFTVKKPVSFIFLYVFLGTVVGLKIYPSIAGLLPRWVIELKTATFSTPSFEILPIRLADLYPVHEFIRLIL